MSISRKLLNIRVLAATARAARKIVGINHKDVAARVYCHTKWVGIAGARAPCADESAGVRELLNETLFVVGNKHVPAPVYRHRKRLHKLAQRGAQAAPLGHEPAIVRE